MTKSQKVLAFSFLRVGMKCVLNRAAMILYIVETKYIITAKIEPTCTATSSTIPWSGKVVKCENKAKCPEELTGKNSVMPCRAERNIS
jgi:hypothetical protein